MAITRKLVVCKTGEIPVGTTKFFRYGAMNGIAYNDQGEMKAYVNACTHMGGTVDIVGSVFRCCRHFAEFNPSTGERTSGQAPEGSKLKSIPLLIEEGIVYAVLELHDEFS